MLPVACPKCSRKSFYVILSACSHCGIVETTAARDNFNVTEPESPRQFLTACATRNHPHPKDVQMDELALRNERQRYEGSDPIIMDNSEEKKTGRSEIGVRCHILPNYRKQGGPNNDFPLEIGKANQMEVDLIIQKECNLKKTIQQCSLSNLDNFESTKNENPESKISNFEASKWEGIHSIDNFYAVPGASGFQDNKTTPNLFWEEFSSMSSLELQPAVETGEKISLCAICRWEVDKHFNEVKGKYKCCGCSSVFSKISDLQKHTSIHQSNFLPCNICGEFIYEEVAHNHEETCNVCLKKFQCKTLLETHTLVHMDYFNSNCIVCGTEIVNVFDGVKRVYNCCHCDYSSPDKYDLKTHLHKHSYLKVFKCDVCGRRFKCGRYLNQHLPIHFRCNLCANSFKNKELLEMHLKAEHTQP